MAHPVNPVNNKHPLRALTEFRLPQKKKKKKAGDSSETQPEVVLVIEKVGRRNKQRLSFE